MKNCWIVTVSVIVLFLSACTAPTPMPTPTPTPIPIPALTPTPPTPKPETSSPVQEAEKEPKSWVDPDIVVDIYDPVKACNGTTFIADNHVQGRPRIIEVNMSGEIIWEYLAPQKGQIEAEPLPNKNVLYIIRAKGVYEINRSGRIVWSYLADKIDHDADRLPNGNTLFVFGFDDQKSDAQVTEVNPQGKIVWTWFAKDHFDKSPYNNIYEEGWTHTNATSRLPNGNTLISPRNFHFVVEVNSQGSIVSTYGKSVFSYQHDPEFLPNGNIIAALQWRDRPHLAAEFDIRSGKIVWQYAIPNRQNWPVRDVNRLSNGNTLITGTTEIVEVTTEGEIVWRLKLGKSLKQGENAALGFYKADRIYQSD
jgi:hypothetical protein